MSRIDNLLKELCPQGVEFRALGEIVELVRGNGLPKSDLTESGVGAIHYGQIYTNYGTWATETISFVAPTTAARLARVDPGDIIITNTSETVEDVGTAVAWLGDEPIVTGGHATVIKHSFDPKYLAYWFQSPAFFAQKRRLATGTKVIDLSAKQLATVRVPVPPTEVQQEVVRVLDLFEELEATLSDERAARQVQYAHYRDTLLTFDAADVKRRPIGDLARVNRGASPRPIKSYVTTSGDGVPWIKIGDVAAGGKYITGTSERITPDGATKSRRVYPGDFVLSNSMSFGRPYISKIEGCIHDGWLVISDFEDSFIPDFLYHLLRSGSAQAEFARRAGAGAVQNLNADIVRSVLVPVPPLVDQRRIADVLDRFETLINDTSSGIPAELSARRTQYEHYRDRLLTFKELAV